MDATPETLPLDAFKKASAIIEDLFRKPDYSDDVAHDEIQKQTGYDLNVFSIGSMRRKLGLKHKQGRKAKIPGQSTEFKRSWPKKSKTKVTVKEKVVQNGLSYEAHIKAAIEQIQVEISALEIKRVALESAINFNK